jgi:ferredoxin--NADP+ reductase
MRTLAGDTPTSHDGSHASVLTPAPMAADYNATLLTLRQIHDGLAIFRILPDGEPIPFEPGQYTVLGLHDVEDQDRSVAAPALIRRAYSFSCSIVDDQSNVRLPGDFPYREFYVALVPPHGDRPTLTPLLFQLRPGNRLFVGRHPKGEYTLHGIGSPDNIVFLGTGTGEAPHNAMLAELLSRGHSGRIIVATSVRYAADLAYLDVHRELERRHSNYRYLALATREPRGPKAISCRIVCGCRLQDYLLSRSLERDAGLQLDPAHTHVFVCGNPAMIGMPQHMRDGAWQFPEPVGMVELLTARGFSLYRPHAQGNIHVERYW